MENESLLPRTGLSSVFFALASLTLVIIGLIYFSGILQPLVIAFFIWFIINQLKESMRKIKIKGKELPGIVRSILAFTLIFVIVFLIAELLIVNIEGIAKSMPGYMANLDQSFGEVSAFINDPAYVEHLQKWIENLDLAGMATDIMNSLTGFVANTAVVVVYVIFFIIEYATYKVKLDKLFPGKGKHYQVVKKSLSQINESISSFIWQKTLISIITGVISYVILIIMGVEYAFLWSFLIFILNYIPYIGPLFSSLFPAVFAVLITGDLMQLVYVFAAMQAVQIVLGNFVEPKMMGKGTNLGPVTVIVALAFWGMIWGMVGMILAVPVTAVFVIILSQIPSARYMAVILSEKGDIPEMESQV
jgi:predicted PurR-regulated permease PerM